MLSFALSATVSWRIEAQSRVTDSRSEKKGKQEANVVPEPQPPFIDRTASPETTGTESEPNGAPLTADPMPAFDPHAIMTAEINPVGDVDFFSFPAPANSRVWIYADSGGTQNPISTSRDTLVDLLDVDGSTLIENDDDDGTGNGGDSSVETGLSSAIAGATLITGGTYFIRVTPFDPAAIVSPYRLFVRVTTGPPTLEAESNDTIATANPGGFTFGSIVVGGDVDYYSITATAGSVLYINADGDPERDGGTDLVVELRNAADAVLLSMNSSGTGGPGNPPAEAASFTITSAGTYFVRVAHFSGTGVGTYTLMLARNLPSNDSACAPSMTTFSNNTPVAISSTGTPTVTSNIVVGGAGTRLHTLRVRTNLAHTFNGDIDMTLTSPAGTIVTLTTDNGGPNANVFNGTSWSDVANPFGQVPYISNNGLVTDHVYANNVLASPLVPEEGFEAFVGENPNGTWTLTISDDADQDGGSLNSWALDVFTTATPGLNPIGFFQNNGAIGIPSTGPFVAAMTINVAGLNGPIEDVDVQTHITHTFAGDLDITVQAPSGKTVTLSTDNGGDTDNVFNGTVWNTAADPDGLVPYSTNPNLTTDHPYVNGVLASPLSPEESLGAFRGESPNGLWRLTVSDDADGDGGALGGFELRIVTTTCPLPSASGVEVGGRVTTAEGNGIRNARVILSDQAGNLLQTALTSSFGFYRFTSVEIGGTYIVSVGSKRYTFTPRVVQVVDNIGDVDFTPEP